MIMKIRLMVGSLVVLLSLWACASSSNRITEYLSGFQPPPDGAQPVALPLNTGLVVVLPEDELGKPTTPSRETCMSFCNRSATACSVSHDAVTGHAASRRRTVAEGHTGVAESHDPKGFPFDYHSGEWLAWAEP